MILRLIGKRSQTTCSSSTSLSYQRMNVPLDLDFVLSLLDSSSSSSSNSNTGMKQLQQPPLEKAAEINLSAWSKIKFKVIDSDENTNRRDRQQSVVDTANNTSKTKPSSSSSTPTSFPDFTSFFTPQKMTENDKITLSTSDQPVSESNISRLQNLADSLPLSSFDRRHTPPASFFDFDQKIPSHLRQFNPEAGMEKNTLPILQRDDVDWKEMTLTKILKKIIPEELFVNCSIDTNDCDTIDVSGTTHHTDNDGAYSSSQVHTQAQAQDKSKTKTSKRNMDKKATESTTPTFDFSLNPVEMRLLDRDQLHLFASIFKVSTAQTDTKIEKELLNRLIDSKSKSKSTKKDKKTKTDEKAIKSIKSMKNDSSSLSWSEENETLLRSTYEKLRVEKQRVDTKFQEFVTSTSIHTGNTKNTSSSAINPAQSSLIRQRIKGGSAERGLWAMLSVVFSQTVGMRVSMSECRKKLIILKRLQQQH